MAITIFQKNYDQLWQAQNPTPELSTHAGFSETQLTVPEQLGQGYIQSLKWDGIDLTLFHYRFHDDVHVIKEAQNLDMPLGEIGFHLSGNRHGYCTGENFIDWGGCDQVDEEIEVTYANAPILKVDIHLESTNALSQFISDALKELPAEIRRYLGDCDGRWFSEVNMITPAMRSPLEQIFHCPFQGRTKQMYLEGKCLELIALKLEQLKDIDKRTGTSCSLKPDDIDRIHHARAILTANLDNPPSLMELARQVSLNDYKLKVGFRQVFGTTVFGYLHQHRMETARQLLGTQRMNIKEVARTVGYANQSRFAAAFRKQFGVNPKAYCLSTKSG